MKLRAFVVAMAVLVAASAPSFAADRSDRLASQGALEPLECVQRLNRVERQVYSLRMALERIQGFARVMGPQERERLLDDIRGRRQHVENLHARLRNIRQRVDDGRFEGPAFCKDVDDLARDVARTAGELRTFESRIRHSIMTARRVGRAIRITDAALQRAVQVVRRTGDSQDAFPGLRRAFELQEKAKRRLVERKFQVALRLTLRARDIVGETVRDALDSLDVETIKRRARLFYEHTNELIERIEAKLGDGENPRARRMLAIAREHQEKARMAVEEGQPYRALQHARAARRVVNEIMRTVFRARQLDVRLERMEGTIERARDAVEESENERAEEVLEQGIRHYERACELAEEGADVRATAELNMAAKLIARSVEMTRGGPSRRLINLRAEIRKTAAVVRRAAALAETNGQENRIEMAQELIEEARGQMDNPEKALALLDKATDIAFSVIAQVKRHPEKPGDEEGEEE